MLYAILKPIVRAALRIYFGSINKNNLAGIDNGRPTLILANHTASFMDAILVACFVRRRIYFFARGDVFGSRWADKLLRAIGLLPVYRISEGRDKLHLNDSSNETALNILKKGGAILIFCEGSSDVSKRLKPFKKGPFRLAAHAAAILAEPLSIVPLGINYIDPVAAGEDVFLECGTPIAAADFMDGTNAAAQAKAATAMMRHTARELNELVWHTEREEDVPVADAALAIMPFWYEDYSFQHTQRVMRRVNTPGVTRRQKLFALLRRWESLETKKTSGSRFVKLVALAPFAAAGLAFHWPAIRMAKFITDHKVHDADFIAPVFLSCCILLTIAWYMLMLLLFELLKPGWQWVPLLLLIAGCGILYVKQYWYLFRRTQTAQRTIAKLKETLGA
jgi:1-acyl-sn-glycerol-3-phosphate acyltransferase